MFAATVMGGVCTGGPDACKTPPQQAPVPYPNVAVLQTSTKSHPKVLFGGTPALSTESEVPMSNGDNLGVTGGVASNKVMNKCTNVVGANTVLVCSKPTARMCTPTKQNDGNCVGAITVVANVKVLVPAP